MSMLKAPKFWQWTNNSRANSLKGEENNGVEFAYLYDADSENVNEIIIVHWNVIMEYAINHL